MPTQSATVEKATVTTKKAKPAKGKVTAKGGGNKKGKTKPATGNGKTTKASPSSSKTTRSNNNVHNEIPEREILDWERKRPCPRPKKMEGYDVEEVSFETGTLFMYRSPKHRRVEYVPRI